MIFGLPSLPNIVEDVLEPAVVNAVKVVAAVGRVFGDDDHPLSETPLQRTNSALYGPGGPPAAPATAPAPPADQAPPADPALPADPAPPADPALPADPAPPFSGCPAAAWMTVSLLLPQATSPSAVTSNQTALTIIQEG